MTISIVLNVQSKKMTNSKSKNQKIVSRFYNQILFKDNRVIKGVPEDRFFKETNWFKEASKRIPNDIPFIYSYDVNMKCSDGRDLKYYEMEAINGTNLYQWAIEHKNDFPDAFNRLILLVKRLHAENTIVSDPNDIYMMYYTKPINALVDFIDKLNINVNNLVINGNRYTSPIELFEKLYKDLETPLKDTRYSFIHGDLTMSNTLIDDKGKLYLIDPRGCFGNTQFFGDIRYDIAKIYYSIIRNFDSLNVGKFSYKRDTKDINTHYFSIVDNRLRNYEKRIFQEFKEDPELILFIHVTIWLSLLPHLANNPNQQWCAFCYGVYLLNTIKNYEN